MSWWNTSNFTDLASKALKNAQEKIDKALDIQDGKSGDKPVSAAASASSKPKADFFSSWTGGEGQSTSDAATGSWGFPWAASSEKETDEGSEPVREKTAEEIKSEVLKAAKERAKAKAKLFPQKKQTGESLSSISESAKKHSDDDHRQDKDSSIGQDTGKASENIPEELKAETSVFKKERGSESDVQDQTEDVGQTEIAELNIDALDRNSVLKPKVSEFSVVESNQESFTTSDSQNDMQGSCFQEITEYEADIEEQVQDNVLDCEKVSQTLPEDTRCLEESSEKDIETSKSTVSEVPSDELKVLSEPEVTLPVNMEEDKVVPSVDEQDTRTDPEPIVSDISSSVEFVTEKDLSVDNEETENVINKDCDSGDQSSSDPEILDYERTCDTSVMKESPESSSAVIHSDELLLKVYSPTDEAEYSDSKISPSLDNADSTDPIGINRALSANSIQLMEMESIERSSSSSDIESGVNKLDTSLDTCTSEETIVDTTYAQYDSDSKSSSSVQPPEVAEVCEEKSELDEQVSPAWQLDNEEEERMMSGFESYGVNEGSEDSGDFRTEDKGELSPANSFVKCMLEDAIDDSKHDDNSDSHSIEKSDGSRSVYSNHESSDEIDTTTSSDIEIISLPTPNGENRQGSPLDPIPLRIALQKTNWRVSPTHRRTDSSDSSNASKDGGIGELSPGRDQIEYTEYSRTQQEPGDVHRHLHELPALNEEEDNPYHPQRLLKEDAKMESHDSESHDHLRSHDTSTDLQQKLGEMAEVLQAREEKLLHQSKENCDLMEANSILRNQLKQSEEAREAEMTDVNELTAEFTQRLTEAEKRLTAAIREKDLYKAQVQDVQAELTKRAGDASLKQLMAEKDEQIQGLLQEGEKLSKSQLQSNTIIKKLRQKEKDNDSTIATQKKKLDTQKEELDHLHKVLESKEELEKKQTEAIAQLNSAVNKQEQEMVRLKSEHEDAVEKARGLQVALDNSYKEMAELHRNNAAQDSKAQERALSAETHVREELKLALEKQQQQARWEKESLNMQIEDLRLSLTRQEKDHNRREDMLKQEIADLQKQLQEDEARTQELTQGVSLATRPLLRQIENLQSTYNAQSSTWERVERNMSDRLGETQNQLAIVTEKERTANEQLMELGSKVASLETHNAQLRQERSQMAAQLEMLKTKVEVSEDAKQNEAAQIEVMKLQMEKQVSDVKREKILLETQLDVEKSKVEQEKKKVLMIQDQMRDMELELSRSRSRLTPVTANSPSPRSVSRQDSIVGSMVSSFQEQSFTAITQDELDRSFVLASPNGNKQSLYEALRQSGAANLLENLQSQLKLREGEITHLQSEIRSLERTRESMAKELVDLSNRNDELEVTAGEVPVLTERFQELDQRYNALLQMYGEKVEESNELRLDLQDIKEMYKSQINQLIGQG